MRTSHGVLVLLFAEAAPCFGFHPPSPPPAVVRRAPSSIARVRRGRPLPRQRTHASIPAAAAADAASATTGGDGGGGSILPEVPEDPLSHPSVSGRWKTMYLRLSDFQSEHGHCRVPRRHRHDPSLGEWVARQRRLRNRRINRGGGDGERSDGGTCEKGGSTAATDSNTLTDERVAALDALGFTWDVRGSGWRSQIESLSQFRREHGHCRVPNDHTDRSLTVFVRNQRRQYALYVSGQRSTLDPDRVRELSDLGFWFGTGHDDAWRRRYEELVEFVEERGHALVPEKLRENPRLGSWVAHQRVRYRESVLSEERIRALEEVGFRWDVRSAGWTEMLGRLRSYVEENGTFTLPRDDGENRDLRTWVRVQRYHRALRERGMPSPMTDNRIQELEGIGFEWTPRRGPKREGGEEGAPTTADWSQLFEQMKDRGVDATTEAKEHWFAGKRSFEEEEKQLKEWDETDVMALWEQGEEEDEW